MRVFRLPRSAYLAVLILLFCTAPLAFATDGGQGIKDLADGGNAISGFRISPLIVLLVIPVLAAVYIARTATIADSSGIRVRALFGARMLPWATIRGLSVNDRAVYAVLDEGAVRLPCVRVANLHELAAVSDGRLPEIPRPALKPAPMKRRR